MSRHISVQEIPLKAAAEYTAVFNCAGGAISVGGDVWQDGTGEAGAIATFVGIVRGGDVTEMFLEHYPEMTEKALDEIAAAAAARWQLLHIRIVHRVGALRPGEEILFVGVAARHRPAAFAACEFVVDYLKSRAPFWKKETLANGETRWVAARPADEEALKRWEDAAGESAPPQAEK